MSMSMRVLYRIAQHSLFINSHRPIHCQRMTIEQLRIPSALRPIATIASNTRQSHILLRSPKTERFRRRRIRKIRRATILSRGKQRSLERRRGFHKCFQASREHRWPFRLHSLYAVDGRGDGNVAPESLVVGVCVEVIGEVARVAAGGDVVACCFLRVDGDVAG